MRYLLIAVLFCSMFAVGCAQYTVKVFLFDVKGRPVMDASIAVEGKYIAGYSSGKEGKKPVLKKFFAMDEFTSGEFIFGVYGLPDTIRVSADAPGFHKYVGSATRQEQPDGFIEYTVTDANSPYNLSDLKIRKKGGTIRIDAFLLQMSRGRYGGGY